MLEVPGEVEVGFLAALTLVQAQGRVLVGGRAKAMVPVRLHEQKKRDQVQER